MTFSIHRQKRLQAILLSLPPEVSVKSGKSMRELLSAHSSYYDECKSEEARVRAIQGDLKYLREEEQILCDSRAGEGTTLRYRLARQVVPSGNPTLDNLYQDLLERGISAQLATDFIRRTQHPSSYFDLPSEQFVTVPDSIRLMPDKPADSDIQGEIVRALRQSCVLKANYQKRGATEATERRLHPLGVLLRGPQHYLIAYDEDALAKAQPSPKMYLINRFDEAAAMKDEPSRAPAFPTVSELVQSHGLADFVHDPSLVKMKLRVWAYVLQLLQHNRISQDQILTLEEDGESAIVTASVMKSGTLYRWLLGFGDKVEVLEPTELRLVISRQASKIAEIYDDE